MQVKRTLLLAITVAVTTLGVTSLAQIKELSPGFNLFSAQQDIQVGKEAAAQVEREQPVVRNAELTKYLTGLVAKLARSPHAGKEFAYSINAISDKDINAFALPGGPLYVNTGLITTAANEAQLVGVLAHEMSHIRLRHSTNQASKANLFQLPLALAKGIGGEGTLGKLAQMGIGLGAGSALLRFSRDAETQADYNGALIMAEAGYDPIQMARLFEVLEAQDKGGSLQFLSDHPNPGNRVQAVQAEIQQMPRRTYATDTRQFARIKQVVAQLPPQGQLRAAAAPAAGPATAPPNSRPTSQTKQYQGRHFTFAYPGNWNASGDPQSAVVTVAPPDGLVKERNGTVSIGYGAQVSYYFVEEDANARRSAQQLDLDTEKLVTLLRRANPGMTAGLQRRMVVNGVDALITSLHAKSPFQGETELDQLVTVVRPEGLWYMILICPDSEWRDAQAAFDRMVLSVRFGR